MVMQVALLTRWEWFKLSRRWVPWIVLGFVLVIEQLVFWLVVTLGNDLSYQSPVENIANGLGVSSFFGPFIAVILAATVLGGEYGWGTLRPALSRGAGRWPFLASKVAVVSLFTAALLIVLSITVMVSGFIAEAFLTPDPQAEGYGTLSWLDLLALYGRMVYSFLPYVALALFMVVLTTSNGVGVALSMGYYIAETVILVPILSIFDWSDKVLAFLLSPTVSAWIRLDPTEEVNLATIGGMPGMAHGFIMVTIYTAVLGSAALALFLRRDITGAKGG